jgi:plasmid stabilization system protein ParE
VNRYVFTPQAQDDPVEIWEYIARDSIDAADRVIEDIFEAAESLANLPGMGHRRDGGGRRAGGTVRCRCRRRCPRDMAGARGTERGRFPVVHDPGQRAACAAGRAHGQGGAPVRGAAAVPGSPWAPARRSRWRRSCRRGRASVWPAASRLPDTSSPVPDKLLTVSWPATDQPQLYCRVERFPSRQGADRSPGSHPSAASARRTARRGSWTTLGVFPGAPGARGPASRRRWSRPRFRP